MPGFAALRSAIVAALAGAALLASLGGASAQGVVRSVHGEWQIRCDTPPGAQSEQCVLLQSVQADDRPNVGLTAIVLKMRDNGKTLLRVLAGLEPLDEGAILLAGTDIAALGAQARQSACLFIPQGGDLLPATVRENLALSAPDACDECMAEALARARIDVSLEADAMRLSGGERQRVGLARAFLAPAPVILIDEPTSALDDATATRLVMALRVLTHERGLTLVMVTHDLALAACADVRLDLKPAMQPEVQP
ncbi:MAG: ATP-binding cassette domain-containing protein [Starkeya sp.]|nr:ATP-binding cassette domain-containing protein [Starkeya sp.]